MGGLVSNSACVVACFVTSSVATWVAWLKKSAAMSTEAHAVIVVEWVVIGVSPDSLVEWPLVAESVAASVGRSIGWGDG